MSFPLSGPERRALWLRLGIRGVLLAVCLILLAVLGPPLCSLFAPFLLALLVAWIFHPPVRWLQKKLGISRSYISRIEKKAILKAREKLDARDFL